MTDPRPGARAKYLDLLFFVGFSLLACHELDAVAQAEWRLLPVLKDLGGEVAYPAFVLFHIPVFALLLWWTGSPSPHVRIRAQLAVDIFMVLHVGLHMMFRGHEQYTFFSTLSEFCIFGAGAVGLAHVVLAHFSRGDPERTKR